MGDPVKVVLFDQDEVAQILNGAARAMAYDINTDIAWEDHPNAIIQTMGAFSPGTAWRFAKGLFGYKSLDGATTPGAATVETKLSKFHDDHNNFRVLFSQNFVTMATKSPHFALAYLTEKKQQTQNSWRNMRSRFQMAAEVNHEVTNELNKSINATFYTKFIAELALNAYSCWGPLGFLANTLVSVGYTAACKIAENQTEAEDAQIIGWVDVASADASAAGNFAMERASEAVKRQKPILETMLISRSEAVEAGIRRVAPHAMNEKWVESTRRLGDGYVRAVGNANRARAVSSMTKGAGFCVGLLFMHDQISKALTGDPAKAMERRR